MNQSHIAEATSAEFDHLAIAVRSIDDSLKLYRQLNFSVGHRERIEDQGVEIVMICAGNTKIELLEPLNESSPIAKFIARKGEGLHHIALKVTDIHQALSVCREIGCEPIDAAPRKGAAGKLIVFLHPRTTNGVLIELTQPRITES